MHEQWTKNTIRADPDMPPFLSRDLEGFVTLKFRLLEVCSFRAVWNMCLFSQIDAKCWGGTGIMVFFMWRTVRIWSNCVLLVSKCHHFDWKNSRADRILGIFWVSTLKTLLPPGAQETVLEVFVGLVRETSSLAMVLSELRTWVGLSAADAVSLFEERVEIEPHWGGRWGLKPSATEVRTCSSQRGPFSIVRHVW